MGKREKLHVQWQGPIQQISNINPSKQIEREYKEKYWSNNQTLHYFH